uniref:Copia protein n=1 Tax=Tanacetum cinerariifolium TaxID=118510 RepID=A0A699H6A0_TANCI|nr:copia protein [Tanacetum cinerariifolium]
MNEAMSNNGTNVTLPNPTTVTPTVTGLNIASTVPTAPHAFYASPGTSLSPNPIPPPGFPPLAQDHLLYYGYTAASTPAHLTPPAVEPVHTTIGLVNYVSQATQPTGSLVMGLAPSSGAVNTLGQATLLPQAFTAWNMDTGGKNCSIEFDSFGFSVKDFMTRRVLLRCDSTGDLYPVMAPSPIPSVFLVSQQTRHQRIGHPESEVLRRLVSNNVISSNKEKPPIVHLDVWTLPISTLSSFKYYVLFLDYYSHFCVGSNKPTQRLNFHVSSVSALPKTYHDVFRDSNWKNATRDEYDALIKNSTWTVVPRPPDANVIRCVWLFQHKFLADALSYGLKQAPRAWFQRFASYITRLGFHHSRCDTSLFIYRQGLETAYLLLYVDDIVLIASSLDLLQRIIRSLHQEFAMTDLGPLNYFLGIFVTRDSSSLFLSQRKYAIEILEKAHMVSCNPSWTPVDTESKLGVDGDSVSDPTLYQSLAGSLQYLTFTRPDISYAFQQVCLHMHDPQEPHLSGLKRILRPTTQRSTSGYCVFLGNNLLSWSAKRQPTLSRSSAEAEYHGVANAVAETCWLRNLLCELHTLLSSPTLVYCDNVSAVYLSCNPVQHQRTKHIEIDIHFVRDLLAASQVCVLHVPSRYQFADIFTKGLPSALFEEFRSSLSVRCPPAPTAREC